MKEPQFPIFILVILFFSDIVIFTHAEVERKEFVSFSVMIQKEGYFDRLSAWLDDLNFSKFTFVIWNDAESYILDNQTRLNRLKQYGKIVPNLSYLQVYSTSSRKKTIDQKIETWKNKVGYEPKGFMSFVPDTYAAQYLLEKNIKYLVGYCFDQYTIDYMTMRGAWQLPYYANPLHVNIPNNYSLGFIIFPHSTWNWIESLRIDHRLSLHPMTLMSFFNGNHEKAKDYFLNLMDYSIRSCEPFGMAVCQFEWEWCVDWGYDDEVKNWINTSITTRNYEFWDFESVAQWFIENFRFTPTYTVDFISPYSKARIEWYHDLNSRIARIGSEVVSYVNYREQISDPYISGTASINWGIPPSDRNCIDTSLSFEIDALGGGNLRSPIKTSSYCYEEKLSEFAQYYPLSKEKSKELSELIPCLILLFCFAFSVAIVKKIIKK